MLALRELLFDNVDFRNVLEARRPFARLEADDAAHDFRDALEEDKRPRDGDYCLEVIDWRSVCRDIGMFADAPGLRSVIITAQMSASMPGRKKTK